MIKHNAIHHYFERSHDPELLSYLTQLYAFGIGVDKDLTQACHYFAYLKDDTTFINSTVADTLSALFTQNKLSCTTKDSSIHMATIEEADAWYRELYWGEGYRGGA